MTSSPASSAESSPALDPTHPWLGLASFTEETRGFFHGRDEEVAELGRRVQRKSLTILFGQSGLGKTSILRAGLVPRLRPEGYCPVYVRLDYGREAPPPAEQIKQAVIRATAAAGTWSRPGVALPGESLWEFLHHRDDALRDASGRALVPLLIFDQFEEIFTLAQGDDDGRRRAAVFVEELADLVENRTPRALEARLEQDEIALERFDFARADYRILIALREDYLAHLEGLKVRMPSVTQNRMRLARMTGAQALAAVTGPGGALVNEEVAQAIVRFVAGGAELERAEVEPSLLSLVCRELNNTRIAQGRSEISADLLAGSRDTILGEFYERSLADQPSGVRVFIEDELLTDSGYRESIAEERVRKAFTAAGASADALAELVDRRLLRIEERLDVRRVELTHDVLCGVVRASRDVRHEREAKAAVERQLAETRAKETATRQALWRARLIAAACAIIALGAAGSAVYGFVNQRRAQAAEARAAQERDRVQLSRAEAEKLVTFLLDDLYSQLEPTGKIEIVSGLARRALDYFEALPPELRDARSERYRGVALSRLGFALSQQGKTLEAEEPLQKAEEIFSRLHQAGDRSDEVTVDLGSVLRQQSRNAYLQNRPAPSVQLGQRSEEILRSASSSPSATLAARLEHGRALMNLGFVLMRDRKDAESLAAFEQARTVFQRLFDDSSTRQRAEVLYAENCAWMLELTRRMGRETEFAGLLDEGLTIATQAVEREAGNLGALRSRALLLGRKTQRALDQHDYVGAEAVARQTTADWTEFLRFDPTNDTAKNNRRVARGNVAEALWRQGRLEAAAEIGKANIREVISAGGSPSTVRGVAFQGERVADIEADLGRVTDLEAAMVENDRMRELGISQVGAESYFRFSNPAWSVMRRAEMLVRMGQPAEALARARSIEADVARLSPTSGQEAESHRWLVQSLNRVRTEANLNLRQWDAAADAARKLVAGRPNLDDVSPGAFDWLASDRALAAVALARAGDLVEARKLNTLADEFNRGRLAAGARDHAHRFQAAMIALGRGLLASVPTEKRAAYAAGLAEIDAIPEEPRALRSVRELRVVLQTEMKKLET